MKEEKKTTPYICFVFLQMSNSLLVFFHLCLFLSFFLGQFLTEMNFYKNFFPSEESEENVPPLWAPYCHVRSLWILLIEPTGTVLSTALLEGCVFQPKSLGKMNLWEQDLAMAGPTRPGAIAQLLTFGLDCKSHDHAQYIFLTMGCDQLLNCYIGNLQII